MDFDKLTEQDLTEIIRGCQSIAILLKKSTKPNKLHRRELFAKMSDWAADRIHEMHENISTGGSNTLAGMTLADMTVTTRVMPQSEIDEIDRENRKHGIW